jgi:molybdate/tungstate transport system permease protein
VASPFVVITAKAAFEGVPRAYEYASRSLGKSRWATFWRVTIPLAWPGILAGVTLAFARAIGEFGATIMMAYYPRTLPVQIWVAFTTLGLDAAFPVALLLAAISIAALVVLNTIGANPWTQ